MKIFFFFLLLTLTACHGDAILVSPNSLPVVRQSNWRSEILNGSYTIQFPNTYTGNGAVGFEGYTFHKNRLDAKATFAYAFCGTTFCASYGQPLSNPLPPTITFANTVLNKRVQFERNGQLQAFFYYAQADQTAGLLFLRDGNQFKESLNMQYAYSLQSEILRILQTIQPN